MKISASARRARMSWSRLITCACTDTSSEATGSSHTISSGPTASAGAMAMRWHWPPENWCGRRPRTASRLMPTSARAASTRRARSARGRPWMARPSATISSTARRGLKEETGSWKIICSRARRVRRAAGRRLFSATPSCRTEPSAAAPCGRSWRMARPIVVLPLPDSPTSPSVSPGATSKDTPSTAWKERPPRRKRTVRSRTDNRGCAGAAGMAGCEGPGMGRSLRGTPGMEAADGGVLARCGARGVEGVGRGALEQACGWACASLKAPPPPATASWPGPPAPSS